MKIQHKAFTTMVFLAILLTTSGCHLFTHYSTEEVKEYISQNYPHMPYTIEKHINHTWTATFDAYPNLPILIQEENVNYDGGGLPITDKFIYTNIPLVTIYPLFQKYLTDEELNYVSYRRYLSEKMLGVSASLFHMMRSTIMIFKTSFFVSINFVRNVKICILSSIQQ